MFAFSAYQIITTLVGYKQAEAEYTGLSNQFVTIASSTPAPAESAAPVDIEPMEVFPFSVDFAALKASSKDAVGWIYSPDTPINYPIVQGTDNWFYTEYLHNGEPNANGAIFLDCREANDFSEQNTIIYGHNMNDGSMFASLRNYRDPAYYPDHPVLYIATPDKYYRVEVVAGIITPADSYIYAYQFDEPEQFLAMVERAVSESTFESGIEVSEDDHLVTLSTCTYEIGDGRYALLGRLVEIAPPAAN